MGSGSLKVLFVLSSTDAEEPLRWKILKNPEPFLSFSRICCGEVGETRGLLLLRFNLLLPLSLSRESALPRLVSSYVVGEIERPGEPGGVLSFSLFLRNPK